MKIPEWLKHPCLRPVRILIGGLLVLCGIFSFLPVLGVWMLPLGLSILAMDIPAAARLNAYLRRKVLRLLVRFRAFRKKHGYATAKKSLPKSLVEVKNSGSSRLP